MRNYKKENSSEIERALNGENSKQCLRSLKRRLSSPCPLLQEHLNFVDIGDLVGVIEEKDKKEKNKEKDKKE